MSAMVFFLSSETHFSRARLYSNLVENNKRPLVLCVGKGTVKPESLRNQEAPVPEGRQALPSFAVLMENFFS